MAHLDELPFSLTALGLAAPCGPAETADLSDRFGTTVWALPPGAERIPTARFVLCSDAAFTELSVPAKRGRRAPLFFREDLRVH